MIEKNENPYISQKSNTRAIKLINEKMKNNIIE